MINQGVEGASYAFDLTELAITPSKADIKSVKGTGTKNKGQNLASWAGEVTPEEVELTFNQAPIEAFAMAMGACIENIDNVAGVAVDQPVLLVEGMAVPLPHALIDSASFSLKLGADTLVASQYYDLDQDSRLVTALTEVADAQCEASYSYNGEKSVEFIGDALPTVRVHIRFNGINAATDRKFIGDIWEATLTPA